MYLNNSIFAGVGVGVGVGVGCSMGLLPPVMDFIGMLHPLGVPFLPRGGGCSLAWPIWGFAAGQGMVFLKYLKCQQNHNNKPMSGARSPSCRPGSVQLNL